MTFAFWGRRRSSRSIATSLGLAITVALATPAIAAEKDLAEELLEALHESGGISESRYQELKGKKELDGKTQALPAVSSSPTWSAKWKNGFKIERSDKAFKLKFGGRIMNDWAAIGYTKALDEDIDGGEGFGTEFRRVRINFGGTVYDRLFFKSSIDFAGNETSIKDAYMGLKFGDTNVRVGHFKEPVGLEYQTSSKYLVFMERSTSFMFNPERNTGLMVRHNQDDFFTLSVGGFENAGSGGDRFDDDPNYNVTARATFIPLLEDDGAKVIHTGVSYQHGFRNKDLVVDDDGNVVPDEPVSFATRPEMHLSEKIIATGDLRAHNTNLMGLELATVCGPLSMQGEYNHTWVDRAGGASDVDFWGAYGQVSYFLTGEHRNYDVDNGRFVRVSPNNNFDPANGHWGAFEVAARYSYSDLTDDDIRGGKLHDVTLALNWLPYPNLRVMTNYIHGERSKGGDVNGGQVRFQVDF